MRRFFLSTLTIALFFSIFTSMTFASNDPMDASPQEVVGGMSEKVVRGVTNIATGWVEFPKQIFLTFKNEGVVKGIFIGPLKGVGMTVVRTVSGAAEVGTFIIPFPGFYDPFFDPAYVWQKE
jgi:putative exosortase-associated protein (TIGR04073 family)